MLTSTSDNQINYELDPTTRASFRVKINNLADESRTIRKEERKALLKQDYKTHRSQYLHRVNVVRPATRATLLAYAFLRKMPYDRVEHSTHPDYWVLDMTAGTVQSLLRLGGGRPVRKQIIADLRTWVDETLNR